MLLNYRLARKHDQDLDNFIFCFQDCILKVEQSGASANPSDVEYLYDRLKLRAKFSVEDQ